MYKVARVRAKPRLGNCIGDKVSPVGRGEVAILSATTASGLFPTSLHTSGPELCAMRSVPGSFSVLRRCAFSAHGGEVPDRSHVNKLM